MGNSTGGYFPEELPIHKVTFTYDFYLNQYEVTNSEFVEFLNDEKVEYIDDRGGFLNRKRMIHIYDGLKCGIGYAGGRWYVHSYFEDRKIDYKDMPVIYVTWWGAVEYCNWLSRKNGVREAYVWNDKIATYVLENYPDNKGFRLPTEAEWEYAAGAMDPRGSFAFKWSGTSDPGKLSEYAVFNTEFPQPVGTKKSNQIGLFDMSGNVYEWCSDNFHYYTYNMQINPFFQYPHNTDSNYRVIRGGSFDEDPGKCRIAYRAVNWDYDGEGFSEKIGFRVAKSK